VDSSVAAALLKQAGMDVIGVMLRLWSEPGKEDTNRCCTPDAMAQARRVAAIWISPSMLWTPKMNFTGRLSSTWSMAMRKGQPQSLLELQPPDPVDVLAAARTGIRLPAFSLPVIMPGLTGAIMGPSS